MAQLKDVVKDEDRVYLWGENEAPLYDETIKEQKAPNVIPYIVEGSKACVVVCSGGGYAHKSDHEAVPVAEWLNSLGISAFVLDYRVAPYRFPCPQLDAKRAVRYARFNAKKYGYSDDKIGIIGFSAGGHLAACCGTIDDDFGYEKKDEIDEVSSRPDFMILAYPVISFIDCGHVGSCKNLLGEDATDEQKEALSIEKCVNENTCPTFLWHAFSDNVVSSNNSFLMALALGKNKVLSDVHIFTEGTHGINLARNYKYVSEWTKLCENWLEKLEFIK